MSSLTLKRLLLFTLLCIPTRLLFSYILYHLPQRYHKLASILLALPAIGFITIFLTGSRKTGLETGGAPIWWNQLRPIHALLYGLASYFAFGRMVKRSSLMILVDTFIGLLSFLVNHYYSNV